MGPLAVLLWKCWIERKRKYLFTLIELLSTFVIFLIYVIYILKSRSDAVTETSEYRYSAGLSTSTAGPAPWHVLYTPETPLTNVLMDKVAQKLNLPLLGHLPRQKQRGIASFTNKKSIEELSQYMSLGDAIVIFQGMNDILPSKLNYTIRMKRESRRPNDLFGVLDDPSSYLRLHSLSEPFTRLQWALDTSYLDLLTGDSVDRKLLLVGNNVTKLSDSPDIEYYTVYNKMATIYSILCKASLILPFIFFTARVIEEKNNGVQELMRIAGVSATSLYMAHLINVLPVGIFYCVGNTVLIKMSKDFPETPFYMFTLMLWLYFTSVIAFGCVLAYILNIKENILVMVALVYSVFIILQNRIPEIEEPVLIMLTGVLIHVPIDWFWKNIGYLEVIGLGGRFEYVRNTPAPFKDLFNMVRATPSLLVVFLFLLMQTILFLLLAWYLSHVRPGPHGEKLPYNFICTTDYWRKHPSVKLIHPEEFEENKPDEKFFESPPTNLPIGIQIIDVTKVFPRHVALSHVSLEVFKGEITLLLGHNGAGKTTLMNIITGIIAPTSGQVLVNQIDISIKQRNKQRQLGLCPQHNMYFSNLTVQEHAILFKMLSGCSRVNARDSSTILLQSMNMLSKANELPNVLSGGMKRRLQLICALASGASVLVLDEPTSGLDVEARRELWDLLLGLRGSHTMLLTTQHMEEADALADRVAALRKGLLKCHATPLFLKKAIGSGYRLSFTTVQNPSEDAITAIIKASVPDASVRDQGLKTLSYNLPSRANPQFPKLFASLESKKKSLGILSMALGKSNLEEVFLRLCSDTTAQFGADQLAPTMPDPTFEKLTGYSLYVSQFAVLMKRQHLYIKSKIISFAIMDICIPIVIIFLLVLQSNEKEFSKGEQNKKALMYSQPHSLDLSFNGHGRSSPDVPTVFRAKQANSDNDFYVTVQLNDTHVKAVYSTSAAAHNDGPMAVNLVSNALAVRLAGEAGTQAITTVDHPLAHYHPYADNASQPKDEGKLIIWECLVCMLVMMLTNNYFKLSIKERETGTRHIHQMCGCPLVLHWFVTFISITIKGMVFLLLPNIIASLALEEGLILDQTGFICSSFVALLLGLVAFSAMALIFFVKFEETTANMIVIMIVIIFGMGTPLLRLVDKAKNPDDPNNQYDYMFWLLPPHVMVLAVAGCGTAALKNAHCILNIHKCPNITFLNEPRFDAKRCCAAATTGNYESFFTVDGGGPGLAMTVLSIHIIFYFSVLIFIERGACQFSIRDPPEAGRFNDAVVTAEAAYVAMEISRPKNRIRDAVLVYDLRKKFSFFLRRKKFVAVKKISFSVKTGECFGLVGVNGAGKSTTFKMLNAEVKPSNGNIFAGGQFLSNRSQYMKTMSYCPQYLGLDEFLTGRQNLNLFLTLRGMSALDAKEMTWLWLDEVGLTTYGDGRVSSYSGGCARRLASAAALCQYAPVALLDEPTAGVDTAARRRLHLAILKAKRRKSIIVTSHDMEEIEVLCDRMCIMSAGEVAVLGSASDLRSRHAKGFSAIYKLQIQPEMEESHASSSKSDPAEDKNRSDLTVRFITQMRRTFNCTIVDEHQTMIHFHIDNVMPYSELFTKMEALKQAFPKLIEDYIVSETTLEEVFIAIAKEARRYAEQEKVTFLKKTES